MLRTHTEHALSVTTEREVPAPQRISVAVRIVNDAVLATAGRPAFSTPVV
jgi:hypothetical protein